MADDEVMGLDQEEEEEMPQSSEEEVRLLSQEQEPFLVPRKVALMSGVIKTIIEGGATEVELSVKSSVLMKVIEYLQYHVDNPARPIEKPLVSANMAEVVCQWDADFIDVDQEQYFQLILAANYLDIQPLLDLACAKVASEIKGKNTEQIRQTFNIVNDFTPEEEEAVRAENRWAEES